MMAFEGSELIGLFFKAFIIVLLSGIIIIPLVPARIKSIVSIIAVSSIVLITSILAIRCFATGGFEYIIAGGMFFGDIPLRTDALSAWFILLLISPH
jgi:hypothetical protein